MPLGNGDARGRSVRWEPAVAAVHHGEASEDANCTKMVRELAFEISPEIGVRLGIGKGREPESAWVFGSDSPLGPRILAAQSARAPNHMLDRNTFGL